MKRWSLVVLVTVLAVGLGFAASQKTRNRPYVTRTEVKPNRISSEQRATNSAAKAELKAHGLQVQAREFSPAQRELQQLDEQIIQSKIAGGIPRNEWYDRIEQLVPSPRDRNGILDEGGDLCANATVIPSLPATLTGNTFNFNNDYDFTCPYTNSSAKDVVYRYTPVETQTVTLSLCRSSYDTKLYVYRNQCSGVPVACNDDSNPLSCPNGPSFTRSYIENLTLLAGNTYYIVVDGYYIYSGPYTLDITVSPGQVNPPPGTQCSREPMFYPGYVDHFNGGCLSNPPVFEPITCGSTVCGTAGYMTIDSRDEDWFQITITEPESLVWKVLAEFAVFVSIATDECGEGEPNIVSTQTEPLDTATVGVCLPPGTYRMSVVPMDPTEMSVNADYNAWLTCFPCNPPEPPVNCLCLNDPNGACNTEGGEIPDGGYQYFNIWVPKWVSITDVNVCLDLAHTFVSDLWISVGTPSGNYVALASGVGGGGDGFRCTTFDDQAQTSINEGEAPFTGSFQPDNPLSALNGENAYGWWTLEIEDLAQEDAGFVNFVCLFVNGEPIDPVECTCPNSPAAVCVNSGAGIYDNQITDVPIEVTAPDNVADINVCLDIRHTYDGDLDIILISPTGTQVYLSSGCGGSGNGFHCTSFDDAASEYICEGTPPFLGTYLGLNDLSNFNGEVAAGTWILRVLDREDWDEGVINWVCLDITTAASPPNDRCEGALPLPIPGSVEGSTCGARDDYHPCCDPARGSIPNSPPPDCDPDGLDLAYTFTPSQPMTVTFSTCVSSYDTKLLVYRGSCDEQGELIACNDDSYCGENGSLSSTIQCLPLEAGITYYVIVDGYNRGECGDFILTATLCNLPNDQCENALPLQFPGATEGSTCGAQDDYHPYCYGILQRDDCRFDGDRSIHECSPDGPDVVYTMTPEVDLYLTLTTCGSDFDTKLLVYAESCGPEGILLACNDDSYCGGESSLSSTLECLPFEAGVTYFIVVDGYSQGECGNFVLTATPCGCEGGFECPEGARLENEEICHNGFENRRNDGCCTSWRHPNTQPISCGDLICGTSGTYFTDDDFPDCHHRVRDHDWYELNLSSRDTVIFSGYAEFPLLLRLGQPGEDDQQTDDDERCNDLSIWATAQAGPCETATIEVILDPGTYWLMVSPLYLYGVPCGARYVISLDCECAECPEGSLAEGEGDCYNGYSDNYNSDCDEQGVQFMNCGDTYCGTGGIYRTNNTPRRDADYYRFELSQETFVRACVVAEYPVSVRFFGDDCDSEGPTRNGDECERVCASRLLDAGTHYVRVRPQDNVSVPCGSHYTIHLSCQIPSDQNRQSEDCLPVSDLTITTNSERHAVLNWTADSEGEYRVYSTTNPHHGGDPDLDEDGIWTLEATVSQTVGQASWVDPTLADGYRNYVVLKLCR